MQTDIDLLDKYFSAYSEDIRRNLRKYYDTLLFFNPKLALVSKSTMPVAATHHFYDSLRGLEIAQQYKEFNAPVYDFGSGNGFPAMILAILRPDLPVVMVERDIRKSEFLKHMLGVLKLSKSKVLTQNVESLPKQSIELGMSRALGSIANVTIQVTSLFKPKGVLFHFKGDNWPQEVSTTPTHVFDQWKIESAGEYSLPEDLGHRFIIVSNKLSE